MTVDGVTYYYDQEPDAGGNVSLAGLVWKEDGHCFLIHLGQAVTADSIRKYCQMKKVEFNVGQDAVAYDTGRPLITDTAKMKDLIRAKSGIRYHSGTVVPGQTDDLLKP
jgi:hypothetical protein